MSFDSKSWISITNPQNTCGISLYVRNNLVRGETDMSKAIIRSMGFYVMGRSGEVQTGQTYFITSLSEGNSAEISAVNRSRCLEDMSGKGAELSRPRIERIS